MFKGFIQFDAEIVFYDEDTSGQLTRTEKVKHVIPDGSRTGVLFIADSGIYKVICGMYCKFDPSKVILRHDDGHDWYSTSVCWVKEPSIARIILRTHCDNAGHWDDTTGEEEDER